MKRFVMTLMLLCSVCFLAEAQRRESGRSRDGEVQDERSRNPHGRPVESQPVQPAPPPPPSNDHHVWNPLPHNPCPSPIIVDAPPVHPPIRVVVINQIVSVEEPEVNEAVLHEQNSDPARSAFDFSADEVVSADAKSADIFFSVGRDGAKFVVGKDADIQDLGKDVSFRRLESVPNPEWSPSHRVHAERDNVYIVWTWDNQFFKFIVTSISESRVAIEWEKMEIGARIAARDEIRNGISHREVADKFER